eukprot:GFUD01131489.1.p1 GENE.GFUD01131489.1~~GFUD01131489.1.p1  ORF type:complete len:279 (+),score=76.19 GFUD01131489.1:809-1645(+)
MSPAMSPNMDSLEVGVLQQELLWLLYDLGHLEKYPMALGNLGDLEEVSATPGRPPSRDIYDEAVAVNQKIYQDYHVYPYTYSAGFHYRQRDFKGALKSWAEAANVIKRYKYSKDDEEIYKEFMEINNELIPHILKADENLLSDPECFMSLLQFYDGLCSWEEDSSTPVLHIGWVKPIVKCFTSFDFSVRAKLDISLADKEEEESATKKEDEAKKKSGKINVTIFSAKMGALKDLIQAEKLNSSALHLQLTAQSQTDVKKSRASLETEFAGRVKRARRD